MAWYDAIDGGRVSELGEKEAGGWCGGGRERLTLIT